MKKFLVTILIVVLCVSLVGCGAKREFKKVYNEAFDIVGVSRGNVDEGHFTFDTNVFDEDNFPSDYFDYDRVDNALGAIKYANEGFGFSDTLFNQMTETSEEDGVQIEENDKYKISWFYSEDTGLEVTYELK